VRYDVPTPRTGQPCESRKKMFIGDIVIMEVLRHGTQN
jgi:hypothetical protein